MSEPRPTALLSRHEAAGAVLTDFAGWLLPLRYGSETAEHHAVRRAAGLFDLSHMGEILVRGVDAAELLDRAFTSDLGALAEGRAKYTLLCDVDGGVLDDLVVYRAGPADYLVVANASNVAVVAQSLQGLAEGLLVDVEDATAATALLAVQGPAAPAVLDRVTGPAPDAVAPTALRRYGCCRTVVAGHAALVGRTGYTGEDGFEIYLPASQAGDVWDALLAAGEPEGLVPVGLAARDTLRLEAGMALYGHELTRDTTPYEAGLGRVVALGKATDFTGRAALAALADQEPVRRLVGLRAAGRRVLRAGTGLARPGTGGDRIGWVSSGAYSPTLECPVALAYVETDAAAPGTVLVADVRGTEVSATVVEPAFLKSRPAPGATPTTQGAAS